MFNRSIVPASLPAKASKNSSGHTPLRSPKRVAVFGLCLAAALAAHAQTNAHGTPQISSTISDQVQPKLTLTQLVQTVLDNNPELRSVQQSSFTAQAAVVSAGALPNPKLEALAEFTRAVIRTKGAVSAEELQAFLAAGYAEQQVLEVILGVALATLCNFANTLAGTELNPELSAYRWEGKKA